MQGIVRRIVLAFGGCALVLASAAPASARARAPSHAHPPAPAEAAAAPPAAPAAQASTGPALWKVSDADTTIYLFGTVHALRKGTVWLDSRIERALAGSDEFVTEVDLRDAKDAKAGILELATLPASANLRTMLPEPDRAAYSSAMTALGLPVEAFDRFKPWYAAMMLSLLPLAREGISAESGVEAVLDSMVPPGRKRSALETVDFQLRLFDTLAPETQFSYLREVSEGVPDINAQLDKMLDRWLHGDADTLATLLNEETSDPVLLDRLLLQRNRHWAKWIESRLKQPGTVFLAVGAGHLAGKGSVQDDLAQDGIATTRVP